MDSLPNESELSDDEIFFGNLSLKEAKKTLFLNDHRLTISNHKSSIDKNKEITNSFKIIEVHSEPEMTPRPNIFQSDNENFEKHNSDPDLSIRHSYSNWDVQPEDSFLKLEKIVSKLCTSPKREELDNTLDMVDRILSSKEQFKSPVTNQLLKENEVDSDNNHLIKKDIVEDLELNTAHEHKDVITEIKTEKNIKIERNPNLGSDNYLTVPVNIKKESHIKEENKNHITTPFKETEQKLLNPNKAVYKTPSTIKTKKYINSQKSTPLSGKKYNHTPFKVNNGTPQHTPLKTPHKTNAYQHIASPVASYIRQCPQVPLLKDVFPKKPISSQSHIPKPLKNADLKSSYKENVMLPPVAYKSAKKTQVISVPEKERMPQSPFAKYITTSLPKPCVIRHDHREINDLAKPLPSSHDSFADLSLHQADVSVCTKKSAFNKL